MSYCWIKKPKFNDVFALLKHRPNFCSRMLEMHSKRPYPEIRPNFSSSHTFCLTATAKIGSDTNSIVFVLTVARFWPQHWLAVGTMPQDLIGCWNQWKLKVLIPRMLFSWMIHCRRRERSILLSFLLFYGLMVEKYALCAMEIQKIHMVVHIFSGFALFTDLMWV